jgi:hypothetical protein
VQLNVPVSRRVLIVLAALIVAVVVVGLIVANLGNGSSHNHHPAANGTSTPPTESSTPAAPSACTLLSTDTISKALHVAVQQGVVTGPAGSRECSWRSKGGATALTLSITNNGQQLVLGLLGNHITGRVQGLGGYAVYASPPPRLAFAASSGVLVTLGPAGYKRMLPKGSTDPKQIPKSTALPPLETLAKAAAAALK